VKLAAAALLLLSLPLAAGEGGRPARVTLSDGRALAAATVEVREDLVLLLAPAGGGPRREIPFIRVRALRQAVAAEGLEDEWRWREGGADEKLATGRKYPWRRYSVELEIDDGTTAQGTLTAGFPLTVEFDAPPTDGIGEVGRVRETLVVQPKGKGEPGQEPRDLIHVRELAFALTEGEERR